MAAYECLNDHEIEQEMDKVNEILNAANLERKATVFKVLGDLNRVKIVEVLMNYDRLCVYEISRFIDASVATTSHHLITLRKNSIIKSDKEGKRVIYSLEDNEISDLVNTASHLNIECRTVRQKRLLSQDANTVYN